MQGLIKISESIIFFSILINIYGLPTLSMQLYLSIQNWEKNSRSKT